MTRSIVALHLIVILGADGVHCQAPLCIGDQAPEIGKDAEWFKGTGVERFERGTVYVLDFWAPWCRPCLKAMPHLNRVSDEYRDRKVKVLGLAVMPMNPMPSPKGYAQRMDYDSGMDVNRALEMRYLARTGRKSLPQTLIVDGEGRVAWLGHPMKGLDEALAQVVKGTYDLESAKEVNTKIRSRAMYAIMNTRATILIDNKEYEQAALAFDAITVELPDHRLTALRSKFAVLLEVPARRKEAYALAAILMKNEEFLKSGGLLWALMSAILARPDSENPDLGLALEAARALAKVYPPDTYFVIWKQAEVLHRMGRLKEAVDLQRRTVSRVGDVAKKRGDAASRSIAKTHEERLKEWETQLEDQRVALRLARSHLDTKILGVPGGSSTWSLAARKRGAVWIVTVPKSIIEKMPSGFPEALEVDTRAKRAKASTR